MNKINIPNFFIIGAPKAGTTALSEYLRDHPSIFISEPKEPHYFSVDIKTRHAIRNFEEYQALFSEVTNEKIIGEASVFYLSSMVAVPSILEYSPLAKFIVMLRNPVDLVYSWHSEAIYNGYETEKNFEIAWKLQDKRKKGENLPWIQHDIKLLMFRDIGALGTQMERLLNIIPRDRIHVIWYDDFKNDTRVEYEKVLRFLNLESDGRKEFPVVNSSKSVRSSIVMELSHLIAIIKKRMGIKIRFGILEKINVPRKSRGNLSFEFSNELSDFFEPEIIKLEGLFDRDLSEWKKS